MNTWTVLRSCTSLFKIITKGFWLYTYFKRIPFLWLLPLRQVATISSRCKSVVYWVSTRLARFSGMLCFGARLLDWELLPGTSLLMVQQSYSFQLSNYDLIFADKYLNTWTTVKSNWCPIEIWMKHRGYRQRKAMRLDKLLWITTKTYKTCAVPSNNWLDSSVLMFVSLNPTIDAFELIVD